jgi:hypothetical protein
MSPSSHMASRMRELYGSVLSRMRFLNARGKRLGRAELVQPSPAMVDQLEPRLLMDHTLDFASPATPATGQHSQSVISVDLNGDGNMDLVTANNGGSTVSILLGNGDGTFQNKHDFTTGPDPHTVIAYDLNGDEILDLITSNMGYGSSANTVSVLLGSIDDDGNWTTLSQDRTDYPAGYQPESVIAADLDGDGVLDLAVANDISATTSDTITVLYGSENNNWAGGTTMNAHSFNVGSDPEDVISGYIDDDNILDLVTTNGGDNTVSVLYGVDNDSDGKGDTFTQETFPTGNGPEGLVAAYINNDSYLDLVTANYNDSTVSVLLGNDDGTFPDSHDSNDDLAVGSHSIAIIAANLDDAYGLDLVTANLDGDTISVLLSNGNGTFQTQTTINTGSHPSSVVAADFNNDGDLDLAVTNEYDSTVSVFLNNGDGTFQDMAIITRWSPDSIISADIDGTNGADLVTISNYDYATFSVFLRNADGTFQPKTDYAFNMDGVASQIYSVTAADLDGQNGLDLAVTYYYIDGQYQYHYGVAVYLNNGSGVFPTNPTGTFATGNTPKSVFAADLNNDGYLDLITANSGSNNVSVLLGYGNGTFQAMNNFATGTSPVSVVAANLNGDGYLDLVTANSTGNSVSVLLGNVVNNVWGASSTSTLATGASPVSVIVADLNDDGKQDLVTANSGTDNVSVLMGNGNGTFQTQATFATGDNPNSVVAADLNDDGVLDLATANSSGNTVSVLLGYGDGAFTAKTDFAAGTSPKSILDADTNGDGKLDLVVASGGYPHGNISILLNHTINSNSEPVAHDDSFVVNKNSSSNTLNVLGVVNESGYDTDADGDALRVTAITTPAAHGTVSLVNGVVTYTPNSNYIGSDSFYYQVSDAWGGTDTALVTVTVAGIAVTSPNGGGVWKIGSTANVTWTSYGIVGNVVIELSTDGGQTWSTLVADTANDGSQTVNVTGYFSGSCKVRVKQYSDSAVSDVSDNTFVITGAGDVTCDGFVDGGDMNIMLSHWNTGTTWATGDITGDGYVDGGDLNILLSNWNHDYRA